MAQTIAQAIEDNDVSALSDPKFAAEYAHALARTVAQRHGLHSVEVYPIIATATRRVLGFYTRELGYLAGPNP